MHKTYLQTKIKKQRVSKKVTKFKCVVLGAKSEPSNSPWGWRPRSKSDSVNRRPDKSRFMFGNAVFDKVCIVALRKKKISN